MYSCINTNNTNKLAIVYTIYIVYMYKGSFLDWFCKIMTGSFFRQC